MKTAHKVTLGPYFATVHQDDPPAEDILPLNLAIEWATPAGAYRIHIYRRFSPERPARVRLESIVFCLEDLPVDMECLAHQVAVVNGGFYLPLEALLTALYRSHQVSRPIFQLLNELSAVVSLQGPVTNQITTKGLLAPKAEARGFRVNAIYRESRKTLVQLAWQPDSSSTRFHVCIANIQWVNGKSAAAVTWGPQLQIGVCQILAAELHRLIPGPSPNLFTAAGIQLLREFRPQAGVPVV